MEGDFSVPFHTSLPRFPGWGLKRLESKSSVYHPKLLSISGEGNYDLSIQQYQRSKEGGGGL